VVEPVEQVEPVEPVVPSVRLVEPVALVRVAVLRLVDSGGGLADWVSHNFYVGKF
jgi:hypothetical protein